MTAKRDTVKKATEEKKAPAKKKAVKKVTNIHQEINAIMREVGYVQKERGHGVPYSYASEAGLIKALRPVMVAHGVFVYPAGVSELRTEMYETRNGAKMNRVTGIFKFKFVHAESGTDFDAEVLGEGADAGDKASGKAATGAYKYALRQTFSIETGNDPDTTSSDSQQRGDSQPEHTGNGNRPAEKPEPEDTPDPERKERPFTAETVKAKVASSIAKKTGMDGEEASQEQRKYVARLIEEALGGKNKKKDRYAVNGWLFDEDPAGTESWSMARASAVIDWLTGPGEEQELLPEATVEVANILREAMKAQGQADMFEEPEAAAKDEAHNRFLEEEQSWAEDGKPPKDAKGIQKGNTKTLSDYPEWTASAEVVLDVTMKRAGVTIGDFAKVPEHKGEIMPINKIKTKYSPAEISDLINQVADLKAAV